MKYIKNTKIVEEIFNNIKHMTQTGKLIPHMLFYGAPGTGKTTTARLIAEYLNKKNPVTYLEINASDNRGIDAMRDIVINFSRYPSFKGRKIIVLDEADFLTNDAQATLRQPMLNYKANCLFILTCNYIHKLNSAIVSRCIKYEFMPLEDSEMLNVIDNMMNERNVYISKDKINRLVKLAKGDIRYIENHIESQNLELLEIDTVSFKNMSKMQPTKIYEAIEKTLKKVDSKYILKGLLSEVLDLDLEKNKMAKLVIELAKTDLAIMQGCMPCLQILKVILFSQNR